MHNVRLVDCNHSGMSKLCTLASSFQAWNFVGAFFGANDTDKENSTVYKLHIACRTRISENISVLMWWLFLKLSPAPVSVGQSVTFSDFSGKSDFWPVFCKVNIPLFILWLVGFGPYHDGYGIHIMDVVDIESGHLFHGEQDIVCWYELQTKNTHCVSFSLIFVQLKKLPM